MIEPVPAEAVTVAIVDDHTLFREGVRLILDLAPDLTYVGGASTLSEAGALTQRVRPAVVLLDLRLSHARGTELLSRTASVPSPPRVLIVTAFPDEAEIAEALRLGARGVVLKDATREVLVAA